MPEYQISHIALVGARIEAFSQYGINNRNELRTRRIAPGVEGLGGQELSSEERRESLAEQLPVWVHNIITDPDFPGRKKLLMSLRRFEGELKDKKDNEVVSAVMTAGFKGQSFNPLDLPKAMPLRHRCSIVAQIGVWKEAYLKLEDEIINILSEEPQAVAAWCELARKPENANVEMLEL